MNTETKNRIEERAKEYVKEKRADIYSPTHTVESFKKYFIAGATEEAAKADILVDALEYLMEGVSGLPPLTAIEGVLIPHFEKAKQALKQYKGE